MVVENVVRKRPTGVMVSISNTKVIILGLQ